MLSCYVNIHFESKCYDYYVKEKVINDLDCHDCRCSLYQASAHFIDGAINLKRGNAVFFLRRQRKTGLRVVNQERYNKSESQLALTGAYR